MDATAHPGEAIVETSELLSFTGIVIVTFQRPRPSFGTVRERKGDYDEENA